MVNLRHTVDGHRAAMTAAVRAVALLVLAVWSVVNLVEGDWVIGALLVGCFAFGLPSLISQVRRMRHHGDRVR